MDSGRMPMWGYGMGPMSSWMVVCPAPRHGCLSGTPALAPPWARPVFSPLVGRLPLFAFVLGRRPDIKPAVRGSRWRPEARPSPAIAGGIRRDPQDPLQPRCSLSPGPRASRALEPVSSRLETECPRLGIMCLRMSLDVAWRSRLALCLYPSPWWPRVARGCFIHIGFTWSAGSPSLRLPTASFNWLDWCDAQRASLVSAPCMCECILPHHFSQAVSADSWLRRHLWRNNVIRISKLSVGTNGIGENGTSVNMQIVDTCGIGENGADSVGGRQQEQRAE